MHIGWPQGIFIGVIAIGLLVAASHDGEQFKSPHDRYRFGVSAMRAVLLTGLLYWGGFFG